jgi:hypothetical protein
MIEFFLGVYQHIITTLLEKSSFDLFCQGMVVISGISAQYFLASQKTKYRMIAGGIGFCGEPFWLSTSYINGQYGIIILCFVYAWGYLRILWSNYKAWKSEVAVGVLH